MDITWATDVGTGLLTAMVGSLLTLGYNRSRDFKRRRLFEQHRRTWLTAKDNEVALCVDIGGTGASRDDVIAALRAPGLEGIKLLGHYRVATGGRHDLASPEVAARVQAELQQLIDDIMKGHVTRVHLFYKSMQIYAVQTGYLLGKVVPVVVYHWDSGNYHPVLEMDKGPIRHGQGKRALGEYSIVEIGS